MSIRNIPGTVLILSLLLSTALPAQPSAELQWLQPAAESHVFNNRNVTVKVAIQPATAAPEIFARIRLQQDGASVATLAEGNLLAAPGSDLIEWIWPTRETEPGEYQLIVSLIEPLQGEAMIPLTVHAAPKLSIAMSSAEDSETGLLVRFQAEVSDPENIPIVHYLWNPGDGSPRVTTEDPVFEHVYRLYEKTVAVYAEAHNSLGGSADANLNIALQAGANGQWLPQMAPPAAGSGCGCERMVIRVSDVSTPFCVNLTREQTLATLRAQDLDERCEVAPENHPSACPRGHTEFACRLGSEMPDLTESPTWMTVGFEVDATLADGSNPNLCLEGQFARSTFSRDGNTAANPTSARYPEADDWSFPAAAGQSPYEFSSVASTATTAAAVPAFGATDSAGDDLWGADDYDAPRDLKTHQGNQIHWLDAPGMRISANQQSARVRAEFLSFVGDPDDSDPVCWCRFEINQQWQRNGQAPTPTVRLHDGLRCELEQPLARRLSSDGIDGQEARIFSDLRRSSIYTAPPWRPSPTSTPPAIAFTPNQPLVFVPGIMGSRLWKQGHEKAHLWGLSHVVWPPLNPLNFRKLDPTRGAPVVADGLIPLVYDRLINFLDGIGYELGGADQNLWIYAYDWRRSNADSGTGLKALVDTILSSPQAQAKGWTHVDIVNHSMGGIVTREAKRQGARVRKDIYLASPHVGAPEAYVFVHPAFSRQAPGSTRPTMFQRIYQGTSVLHNLRRFLGNRFYRYQRNLAGRMASTYELMPDVHYLNQRSMVPGVSGLPDHYFGTNAWQFRRGTHLYSNVRRGTRYKENLPLPTAGGQTLVIYAADQTTIDTTDFSANPVTARDSGQGGDVTVPTNSGSLLNSGNAVEVNGTHRQVPVLDSSLQLIRYHLIP